MATENAALLRPIYAEWGRGNWQPYFEIYDPEMEWGWSDEFPDLGGVYRDSRNPTRGCKAGSVGGRSGVPRRTNTSSAATT
jgi:hypothetical protein